MRSIWIVFLCVGLLLGMGMADGSVIIVDDHAAHTGDMIRVPIRIEEGRDVGALELLLRYDPSILSPQSFEDGVFDNTVVNLGYDRDTVKVVAFQSGNSGINGNFTVCNITFEATGTGVSRIDLEVVTLTDATPRCNNLSYMVQDGTVTIYREESDQSSGNPSGGGGGGSSGSGWWYTTPAPASVTGSTPEAEEPTPPGTMIRATQIPPSSVSESKVSEKPQPPARIRWVNILVAIFLLLLISGILAYIRSKKV